MKTKTSFRILAATFAAAMATSAFAQITPSPTGVNTFAPANAFNAASYALAFNTPNLLSNLYFDSNANLPSTEVNTWVKALPAPVFLAGGGTVKTIFLGESAGSLNDFGFTVQPGANLASNASYIPLATDIDNNNGFIASGWETYTNYGAGQKLDFWLNNPGLPGVAGGAYFSFAFGGQTSSFAGGDATSHIAFKWINVNTQYVNGSGVLTIGLVPTLLVAFEDLRPNAAGPGGGAPLPVDGDYTDFVVAFQFLNNQAVPEPSTYGMIGAAALLGLVGYRRFKSVKTVKA